MPGLSKKEPARKIKTCRARLIQRRSKDRFVSLAWNTLGACRIGPKKGLAQEISLNGSGSSISSTEVSATRQKAQGRLRAKPS